LLPVAEAFAYSPLLLYPVCVMARALLAQDEGFCYDALTLLVNRPILVCGVAAALSLPISADLIGFVWRMLTSGGGAAGIGRAGNVVRRKLLNGEDVSEEIALLTRLAVANFSWAALEARLWLWVVARSVRDPVLEKAVRAEVDFYMRLDRERTASRFLWPHYLAWQLRAEMAFRKTPGVVPPRLPG
jgi:hypothetical protein